MVGVLWQGHTGLAAAWVRLVLSAVQLPHAAAQVAGAAQRDQPAAGCPFVPLVTAWCLVLSPEASMMFLLSL